MWESSCVEAQELTERHGTALFVEQSFHSVRLLSVSPSVALNLARLHVFAFQEGHISASTVTSRASPRVRVGCSLPGGSWTLSRTGFPRCQPADRRGGSEMRAVSAGFGGGRYRGAGNESGGEVPWRSSAEEAGAIRANSLVAMQICGRNFQLTREHLVVAPMAQLVVALVS